MLLVEPYFNATFMGPIGRIAVKRSQPTEEASTLPCLPFRPTFDRCAIIG
ncbi:hypothetical protein RSOL_487430 [Rhizoctonia solani AG-3 Rhs1AP]|uniref:Uncharacterized protein n=1 Tax=Rhizoctonia solani AG-3 Rhs1AP TaxID=1086054 RepID=X8JHZ2_9AGAM|nr:hypothetical protein RSOL_487430 [Rhizoctonia solani AG-3 Rhs1AP]